MTNPPLTLRTPLSSLLALLALAIPVPAGPIQYRLTDLGDLPGGASESLAIGINNGGVVVGRGTAATGGRAFLWRGGRMRNLGDLPGGDNFSEAIAINNRGQVIGSSFAATGRRAFLWQHGNMMDLGDLPGGLDASVAHDINRRGWVVGNANIEAGSRGFLWRNGVMTQLGDLREARSINDKGQIVGYTMPSAPLAALWDNGTLIELGDLPGGQVHSSAYAINNLGQVVGGSAIEDGFHPFLWEDGVMLDLGNLDPPSDVQDTGTAWGINDLGQVVGSSAAAGNKQHAFLWQADTGMLDLNDLLDSSGDGWTLEQAFSINYVGQIVGYGRNPDGQQHAFLLTPVEDLGGWPRLGPLGEANPAAVPEPSALALFGLTLVGLLGYRRLTRR